MGLLKRAHPDSTAFLTTIFKKNKNDIPYLKEFKLKQFP
jgi:hypothetical protein